MTATLTDALVGGATNTDALVGGALVIDALSYKINWYVDSVNGNDANSGKTAVLAFKTIAAATAVCIAGDIIALACGSTFTELVTIPVANLKITTYGSGANPIIDGGGVRQYCVISAFAGTELISLYLTNATIAGTKLSSSGFYLCGVTATVNTHNYWITGAADGILNNCIGSVVNGGNNYLIDGTGTIALNSCIASGGAGTGFNCNLQSGIVTMNNCISTGHTGALAYGFQIGGSSNVTLNDCLSYNNVKNGFNFVDTVTHACTAMAINCYAYSNGEDGFSANGANATGTTVSCWYCKAYLNGTAASATAGDGFTAHILCTMNLYYCIGNKNFKAGAAMTQTASGVIYGCSFYDNYEATSAVNNGIWMNATGTWVIKNTITKHHEYEIEVTAAAIAGGLTLTCDYNCYHDSRGGNAFSWNGAAGNYAAWLVASGLDTHSINIDPLFTAPITGDFTLQALSPCINGGVNLGTIYDDALDPVSVCPGGLVTRQQNTTWDIGSYGGY